MAVSLFGGNKYINLNWWTFPGGERNVKILDPVEIQRHRSFTIECKFSGSNDLIDILLLVNAVRNVDSGAHLRLLMPYFPFARQDRVMTEGEPLALQVAVNLIKSCNFHEVEVWDPHSDVLVGMFEPGILSIKHQYEIFGGTFNVPEGSMLVSPDAGALKKIYKLAKILDLPVAEATKVRDVSSGDIVATRIDYATISAASTLIVVDDICDGGRTYQELARTIRNTGYTGDLMLCVTHGIFSKGLAPLDAYDKIIVANNMSGSRVAIYWKSNDTSNQGTKH